jgi:hypothetical protein
VSNIYRCKGERRQRKGEREREREREEGYDI